MLPAYEGPAAWVLDSVCVGGTASIVGRSVGRSIRRSLSQSLEV